MKDFCYIALGDSIALGTITYWSGTVGYPIRMLPELRRRYGRIAFRNFARNGDRAEDLLLRLKTSASLRHWVQNADLITLCIGGNNVMAAVQIPGFTRAYLPGLEAGTRRFERVYPQIIRELRRLNPHCRLLSMTVYNAYSCRREPALFRLAQKYLGRINRCIRAQEDVILVDAAQRFSLGPIEKLCCLYPRMGALFRNPHPTPWGQLQLAQLHLWAIPMLPCLTGSVPPEGE